MRRPSLHFSTAILISKQKQGRAHDDNPDAAQAQPVPGLIKGNVLGNQGNPGHQTTGHKQRSPTKKTRLRMPAIESDQGSEHEHRPTCRNSQTILNGIVATFSQEQRQQAAQPPGREQDRKHAEADRRREPQPQIKRTRLHCL